jgi:Prokaryotic N-terminal methylation motif
LSIALLAVSPAGETIKNAIPLKHKACGPKESTALDFRHLAAEVQRKSRAAMLSTRDTGVNEMQKQKGFSLIELLIVGCNHPNYRRDRHS